MVQEYLLNKIEEWARDGLISPEQAEALKHKEREGAAPPAPEDRVHTGEILVYLGSLVVVLALAFLVGLNWMKLGSTSRILSAFVPPAVMLALGWRLRGSKNMRLDRGAQALLLGGCLLIPLSFGVTFHELNLIGDVRVLALVSSLWATGIAGIVFVFHPSIAQSVAFHLCGSAVLFAFGDWLDERFPKEDFFYQLLVVLAASLAVGGSWLSLSAWHRTKAHKGLVSVSRVFGSMTILSAALILAMTEPPASVSCTWQKTGFEILAFLLSVAFIVAGVRRKSHIYLYGGAVFLFLVIIYVNLRHFSDKIGMPIALLIIGGMLIGAGLGTHRLSKRIKTSP